MPNIEQLKASLPTIVTIVGSVGSGVVGLMLWIGGQLKPMELNLAIASRDIAQIRETLDKMPEPVSRREWRQWTDALREDNQTGVPALKVPKVFDR